MKHISIEGMDGVGKTTICRLLAKITGFEFVEKPLHYLFEEAGFYGYRDLARIVNKNSNRDFTSLFYGLGSIYMYERFKDRDIITDRHLASNYAWSGTETNRDVYELLVKKIGRPELTVILYAKPEEIFERLKKRNPNDSDLSKVEMSEQIYGKMIQFCKEMEFTHLIIDTTKRNPESILEEIMFALSA